LAALPALYNIYYSDSAPTNNAFLWNWVFRPAFLWELVHLVWLPLALLLTILGALLNLLTGRKSGGLNGLFKADSNKSRLKDIRIILLAVMLISAAYGYWHQLQPPEINEVSIQVPDLHPALNGFKIALVSDLHYGRGQNLTELATSMAQAAAHRPDLVILAGDLVDRKASFGLDYRIPLLSLREVPYGVYAVLGNHDKKVDSVENLISNLEKTNLHVLQNRRVNLPNVPITLVGFDDQGSEGLTHHGDTGRLLFETLSGPLPRYGDLIIVVSHRPEGVNDASAQGTRLFLAGHTHGGQVALPWDSQINLASMIFGFPYSSGEYKISDMTLFVTKGLASGFQARFFAWPEIAILTLTARPD
jgi:predicted MPP superfamily phosphohydrolase